MSCEQDGNLHGATWECHVNKNTMGTSLECMGTIIETW